MIVSYLIRRTDSNQKELVAKFRSLGASVAITSGLGHGIPDIVIGLRGRMAWVEIKDGKKALSQQKLTPDEQKFHSEWHGMVYIIRSEEEAEQLVRKLKNDSKQVP